MLANLIAIPICNIVVMPAALVTLIADAARPRGAAAAGDGLGHRRHDVVGRARRGLPGAVRHVPAIPTAAFALMMVGGLWLALWQTRWRLLGLAPVAGGIALAPMRRRPTC